MNVDIEKTDLVHPELSYKIIGCAYDLFNEIGGGHKENVYQRGLGLSFNKQKLNFKEQVYFPVTFNNVVIGRNYFDFLVDDKIVIEIKSLNRFTKAHYDQVLNYLNVSAFKLAILITFTPNEVRYKRVINFKSL